MPQHCPLFPVALIPRKAKTVKSASARERGATKFRQKVRKDGIQNANKFRNVIHEIIHAQDHFSDTPKLRRQFLKSWTDKKSQFDLRFIDPGSHLNWPAKFVLCFLVGQQKMRGDHRWAIQRLTHENDTNFSQSLANGKEHVFSAPAQDQRFALHGTANNSEFTQLVLANVCAKS